jgi:hypothetical protein
MSLGILSQWAMALPTQKELEIRSWQTKRSFEKTIAEKDMPPVLAFDSPSHVSFGAMECKTIHTLAPHPGQHTSYVTKGHC